MTKVYADVTEFKKLEAAMRAVPNSIRDVLAEIDKLSAAKRSADETIYLNGLREETIKLHADAKVFYANVSNIC